MKIQSSPLRTATIAYIAPFLAFVGLLQLEHTLSLPPAVFLPLRFLAVLAILLTVSRPLPFRLPSHPVASVAVGIAVFLIWIGPDVLFGYRHHWLFDNAIVGSAVSSVPAGLQHSAWFKVTRTVSSVALVPVLEELFWRGWMMRWLIFPDFQKVPLGKYTPFSFWLVAVLFASEHGPYWEVGLASGIVYNWWMIRCRDLADCIVAHAVTNALLAAYVLLAQQWQYWL